MARTLPNRDKDPIGRAALLAGYSLAMVFVLLSAARDVAAWFALQQHWENPLSLWPVHVVVLVSFVATAAIASVWSFLSSRDSVSPYKHRNLIDTVLLNVTTMISWAFTFLALERVLPATLAGITVGLLPLFTLLLAVVWQGQGESKSRDYVAAVVVLVGVLGLSWQQLSVSGGRTDTSIWIGILLSVIASAFAAGNNVLAKRLNNRGVTAAAVFGSRFWLLVLVASGWAALSSQTKFPNDPGGWGLLIALGVLGVAAPIMCLQLSIEKIGPKLVGFLIASIPVAVLLVQDGVQLVEDLGIPLSFWEAAGILVISVGVYVGLGGRFRRRR